MVKGRIMGDDIKRVINDRNSLYFVELENFFREVTIEGYVKRSGEVWNRDYSSPAAYEKSIEKNRLRWNDVLSPPDLKVCGEVEIEPYDHVIEGIDAKWVRIPLNGGLRAEAILALPVKSDKKPSLVIAQHGVASSPEKTFGLDDEKGAYHSYARELIKEGFSVLAPFNLSTAPYRNRIQRMAAMIGTTLPGLELKRVQILLDYAFSCGEVDTKGAGIWGISLGGFATQLWMPLEKRIIAGVSCAWFNNRLPKMIIPDPRYSCFLDTTSEHAFLKGWLTEFDDSDLVSLICPRAFLAQTGKADRIAWWPMAKEEFERTKIHYDKLGIGNRIDMDLHEGGHEIRVRSGIEWMKKWLRDV